MRAMFGEMRSYGFLRSAWETAGVSERSLIEYAVTTIATLRCGSRRCSQRP